MDGRVIGTKAVPTGIRGVGRTAYMSCGRCGRDIKPQNDGKTHYCNDCRSSDYTLIQKWEGKR